MGVGGEPVYPPESGAGEGARVGEGGGERGRPRGESCANSGSGGASVGSIEGISVEFVSGVCGISESGGMVDDVGIVGADETGGETGAGKISAGSGGGVAAGV